MNIKVLASNSTYKVAVLNLSLTFQTTPINNLMIMNCLEDMDVNVRDYQTFNLNTNQNRGTELLLIL
jgi:hypothetical protein